MKKVARVFAYLFLGVVLLSLFGWMSVQISQKEEYFGSLSKVIKELYTFPDLFVESVEEVKTRGLPETFIKTSDDFTPINNLDEDLLVLISFSDVNNSRSVVVTNLRTDSVFWKWNFTDSILEHRRIFHPLLLPDTSLVYSYGGESFTRVDATGERIWNQKSIWPHHSKELDAEGNIWLGTYPTHWMSSAKYKINGKSVFYHDEYITKVSSETGEVLFNKSMTDILRENGLTNYLLKCSNLSDPIHTNDFQPALKTTPFYEKDDVFISAKNLSSILHYRPSTNEVIEVLEGPFLAQHDVDFYGDSSLVFFNNNYYPGHTENAWREPKKPVAISDAGSMFSSIVRYDFATRKYSFVADSVFKANGIFTITEGLVDFISDDMILIEQQNNGVIWVIKDDEVVYKNVYPSHHEGYHHLPNWTRVLGNF